MKGKETQIKWVESFCSQIVRFLYFFQTFSWQPKMGLSFIYLIYEHYDADEI